MRKFIAVLGVLAFTGLVATAADSTKATPSITVSGQGKVVFVPDIGYIQVGVSSDGLTAAEAWKKNEEVVRKIFAVLKDMGLEERDFKTSNLNVQPRYLNRPNEAPKFLGYTVSYDLSVTVRKLDRMGALLDAMMEAGANRHMNVSFGTSRLEELTDEARVKAVAEARKKANLYVTGAGAKLGEVLGISDTPYNHHLPNFPIDAQMVREGKASLPIAAGEQTMTVTVTITWAIDNRQSTEVFRCPLTPAEVSEQFVR